MGVRYYRFDFTGGSGDALILSELELLRTGVDISTGTVTADNYTFGYPPANAIDNTAGVWQATGSYPHWWQIDLGSSVAVISAYSLSVLNPAFIPYAPTAWTLSSSEDGVNWAVIDTRTGIAWSSAGESQTFSWISYALSGTVKDDANANAVRTVRAYVRSSGVLAGQAVSASDGTWTIAPLDPVEHVVVCLDDSAGPLFNDLICRATPV